MALDALYRVVFDCLPPHAGGGDDDDDVLRASDGADDTDVDLGGGEDRISGLPDLVLTNILSRLPVTDAVQMQLLSRRWSPMWKRTPLVLDDLDLHAKGHDARAGYVSRALIHHPGPFRSVRLSFTCFGSPDGNRAMRMWLRLLAKKRVTDSLVLVNPSVPIDLALPSDILRCCDALQRLYLAFFTFPSTKGLGLGCSFPELKELVLCHTIIEPDDLARVLRASPALETLALVASFGFPAEVCVDGQHSNSRLGSLVLWHSTVEKLSLLDTARLERVVLWNNTQFSSGEFTALRLSGTSSLSVLGYLDLGFHRLVIGDAAIQPSGTSKNQISVVPSVRVLALRLELGDKQHAKRFAAYLRCFPSVDTLHVESYARENSSVKVPLSFWQKNARDIHCISKSVRDLFFHRFRGSKSDMAFLRFFIEEAGSVQRVIIIMSPECQAEDVWPKIVDLGRSERASEDLRLLFISQQSSTITFEVASDRSVRDPFYCMDGLGVAEDKTPLDTELVEEEDT